MRTFFFLATGLCLCGSLASAGDDTVAPIASQTAKAPSAQPTDFFEARIRPILAEHCFRCHGPRKQESRLRLDSRQGLLKGTDSGPVVVPGQPEESPLIVAIRHDSQVKMPPKAKLPAQAIADLTTWVKLGVPWPESSPGQARSGAGEPTKVRRSGSEALGISTRRKKGRAAGEGCRLAADFDRPLHPCPP